MPCCWACGVGRNANRPEPSRRIESAGCPRLLASPPAELGTPHRCYSSCCTTSERRSWPDTAAWMHGHSTPLLRDRAASMTGCLLQPSGSWSTTTSSYRSPATVTGFSISRCRRHTGFLKTRTRRLANALGRPRRWAPSAAPNTTRRSRWPSWIRTPSTAAARPAARRPGRRCSPARARWGPCRRRAARSRRRRWGRSLPGLPIPRR